MTTPERIFHIATRADWDETLCTGSYTTSTIGRTLAEEGFIHASQHDQVDVVFERYYRSAGQPLVLLTIDPGRLSDAEVRVESVGDDTYPHVYGPINRTAVVGAEPLDRNGRPASLGSVVLQDMVKRMAVAMLVMVLVVVAVVVGTVIVG